MRLALIAMCIGYTCWALLFLLGTMPVRTTGVEEIANFDSVLPVGTLLILGFVAFALAIFEASARMRRDPELRTPVNQMLLITSILGPCLPFILLLIALGTS